MKLEDLLMEFDLTQYEAQTLSTLIRYHSLSAKNLSTHSGVPHPKIYSTTQNLQKKGFIDIFSEGRKKIYLVKPRNILQKKLQEKAQKFQNIANKTTSQINNIYHSEEVSEIPFFGISGQKAIQEHIHMMIDTAKSEVVSFLHESHYKTEIIQLLNEKTNKINIKLIFRNNFNPKEIRDQLKDTNVEFYQLKAPSFQIVETMMGKIDQMIPFKLENPFVLEMLTKLTTELPKIFGLMMIDWKRSFFRVPIPVDIPIALYSTLDEIIKFHKKGMKSVLESSKKIS